MVRWHELKLPGNFSDGHGPHAFTARYRVTLGPTLGLALAVRNTGRAPITFEEALHTYFAVQYVREVTVTGLEQTEYLDKVEGFARKRQGAEPIRFTAETDRIYLATEAAVTINDPGRHRHASSRPPYRLCL